MKFSVSVVSITLALLSVAVAAPIDFEKRRFGQEHTPRADADFQAMKDISVGTGFEAQLGDLSGAAVRALLAKAGACDQQDVADQCVDFAHQIGKKFASSFGPQKEADLIKVCKDYRTLERNTPNDGQPSELCNKQPRNKELKGLVQAQDPGSKTNPPKKNPPKKNPPKKNPPKKTPSKVNNIAFTSPVGGVQMPLITKLPPGSGANFEVNGSKFQNIGAAQNRQCDIQHNLCFNKFNGGDHSFQGSDCDNQNNNCKAGDPVFSN